jgi:hypothetical protein
VVVVFVIRIAGGKSGFGLFEVGVGLNRKRLVGN